ncbi:hypothetical protein LTR56_004932 [Elasticomyces elasticus]|nr:hypothetical protein LTR56_004932 [Elasticomyces elasticus]
MEDLLARYEHGYAGVYSVNVPHLYIRQTRVCCTCCCASSPRIWGVRDRALPWAYYHSYTSSHSGEEARHEAGLKMPILKKLVSKFSLGKKIDGVSDVPEDPAVRSPRPGKLKRANAKLRKRNGSVVHLNAAPEEDLGEQLNGIPRRFMRSFVSLQHSSRVNSLEPEQHADDFDAESREASQFRRIPLRPSQRAPEASDGSMVSRLGLRIDRQALQARQHRWNDMLNESVEHDRRLDSFGQLVESERPRSSSHAPNGPNAGDGSMVSDLGLDVNAQALQAAKVAYHGDAGPANKPICPLESTMKAVEDQESRRSKSASRRKPVYPGTVLYDLAQAERMSWQIEHGSDAAADEGAPAVGADAKESVVPGSSLPSIRDLDWGKVSDSDAKLIADGYDVVNPRLPEMLARRSLQFKHNSESSGSSPVDSLLANYGDELPVPYEGRDRSPPAVRTSAQLESDAAKLKRQSEEVQQRAENEFTASKEEAAVIAMRSTRELAKAHLYDAECRYTVMRGESSILFMQSIQLKQEAYDRQQAEELQEQIIREEQEAARLADERARLRDCNVCGDAKDPLEFSAKQPTVGCMHPVATCNECLVQWMATEIDEKGGEGIKCPECPETLEYADVQRCASDETFEAYDKMITRLALGGLEDFAWCLAPSCDSGQENPENRNFMDCKNCGYKQCLKHKIEWHVDETCEQYDYRISGARAKDEERQTETMLDTVSKKCPGGCGWRIEKTDGCDHMTCKKCKWEFCWQCLASQKEIKRIGNTAHEPGCKFHSTNLDVAWPFNAH